MEKRIEKYLKKFKKIMFVEDGSIDVDNLQGWAETNGIQIIVYRQGSTKPEIKEI